MHSLPSRIVVAFCFSSLVASMETEAGQLVYATGYVPFTVVQGEGSSVKDAEKDAMASIPRGYSVDSHWTWVLECTKSNALLKKTRGKKCDLSIRGNRYRITQPLKKLG